MNPIPIIVKGMSATLDLNGSLTLRVRDSGAAETVLVFGPAMARNLPQLIAVAPQERDIKACAHHPI